MKVSTEFHYDSAHRLPFVPEGHKCGFLHGHTYVLIVTVAGEVGSDGFVVDFAVLKDIVVPLITTLDHKYLNDIPGLFNPTVEVQLDWFWCHISSELPPSLSLASLTLREGLNNSATKDSADD